MLWLHTPGTMNSAVQEKINQNFKKQTATRDGRGRVRGRGAGRGASTSVRGRVHKKFSPQKDNRNIEKGNNQWEDFTFANPFDTMETMLNSRTDNWPTVNEAHGRW